MNAAVAISINRLALAILGQLGVRKFSDMQPPFVYLGGKNWRLPPELTFAANGKSWTIPAGFVTDFASSPRITWAIVPPFGDYLLGALAHDFLYRTGAVPRAEADAIFYALMVELGVPWWKRTAMYLAVRAGGWASYKAMARARSAQSSILNPQSS
jgi:hypothetical protein